MERPLSDIAAMVNQIFIFVRREAQSIRTRDDILISIPNSIIANTKMVNESAPDSVSRIRVKVGVAYGSDLKEVERILLNVAEQNELVLREPAPEIRFRQFSDSALELELLCWINVPEQKGRTIHQLNWAIHEAFQKGGIEILCRNVTSIFAKLNPELPAEGTKTDIR